MAVPAAVTARRAPVRGGRAVVAAAVLVGWLVLWAALRGIHTLPLGTAELTPLHRRFNEINDAVGAGRNSNPVFLYVFNEIRLVIDTLVTFLQGLFAQPSYGRPVPLVGWLGVVALVGYASWVFGNVRVAALAVAGFVLFGLQGLWRESMDTLALTLAAVLVSLLIGIPLGVWAGLSDRVYRLATPVLDFMQTMPTFVYLAPLTLFFLIGPASATIATLIFATPPAVRITAHAIRSVPAATVEAAQSLGATRGQTLATVLLPLSKRTVVLGVNQTIMAALSMVTIAALIDAPGLGKTVVKALETLDVGTAFNAGLAIVVLAVLLDRVTTAASEEDARRRGGRRDRRRRPLLLAGAVLTGGCVWLSHTYVWAAQFPAGSGVGAAIARTADSATAWAQGGFAGVTGAVRDVVTTLLLNPSRRC